MIVQHNITSMNANRQLGIVGNNLSKATEKLSSGYRINRAADDAAGLAISEKMRAQVRGLNRASDNAQDGISLIQTAEGAMEQQHAILQRTRELLVQASNSGVLDATSENDFQKIQDEIDTLKSEYERINTDTEFNRKKLLNGDYRDQYLQLGANNGQGIKISINTTAWDPELYLTKDAEAEEGEGEEAEIGAKTINGVTFTKDADGKFVNAGGDDYDDLVAAMKGTYTVGNTPTDAANKAVIDAATDLGYTIRTDTDNNAKADIDAAIAAYENDTEEVPAEAEGGADDGKIYNANIFTKVAAGGEDGAAEPKTKTINGKTFTEDENGDFVNGTDKYDDLVAAMKGTYTVGNTPTDAANAAVIAAATALGYTINTANDNAAKADIDAAIAAYENDTVEGPEKADDEKAETKWAVNGEAISALLDNVDAMIKSVTTERSKLGAIQNRLEYTVKVDDNTAENLQSAESRIRDTDMADEMTRFSKESILQQAATSMLAQANQANQGVLSLLG